MSSKKKKPARKKALKKAATKRKKKMVKAGAPENKMQKDVFSPPETMDAPTGADEALDQIEDDRQTEMFGDDSGEDI